MASRSVPKGMGAMRGVHKASLEALVVCGGTGMSYDANTVDFAIGSGRSYDSTLIKLTAKLDASLMLLNRHLSLDNFTVDAVVAQEDQEQGRKGVLSFLQDRVLGSQVKDEEEIVTSALTEAWMACQVKGYDGLHVIAKVTPDTMPDTNCRKRYTPGQYGEALLHGLRAYYMFQHHVNMFERDALSLWGGGGGGCVEPVGVCVLVLAWRFSGGLGYRSLPHYHTSTTTASTTTTTTTPPQKGRKRPSAAQIMDERESPITPARKKARVGGRRSMIPLPVTAMATEEEEEDMEEEEEEEEIEEEEVEEEEDISEAMSLPIRTPSPRSKPTPKRTPSPQKLANKRATPQKLPIHTPAPQKLPIHTPAPQKLPIHTPAPQNLPIHTPAPQKLPIHTPAPQKLPIQRSTPQKAAQREPVTEDEEDMPDITFGFERSTPRGSARRATLAATPTTPRGRKSMLPPLWSEEEKEEMMDFFDTLKPNQTEQTRIALTCKFATMRFGHDLPSKTLYQWVGQKGRSVLPPLDTYELPGGDDGIRAASTELFRSLNPDVSESKRIDFTCRLLKAQYEVEIDSKKFYNILNKVEKKKAGKGRGRGRR